MKLFGRESHEEKVRRLQEGIQREEELISGYRRMGIGLRTEKAPWLLGERSFASSKSRFRYQDFIEEFIVAEGEGEQQAIIEKYVRKMIYGGGGWTRERAMAKLKEKFEEYAKRGVTEGSHWGREEPELEPEKEGGVY